MNRLVVDDRYRGQHGIGRYAEEALRRLATPWVPLGASGSPTAFTDIRNSARSELLPTDVLYSPGYAVGATRALQVPTVHDLIHIRQPRRGKGIPHRIYYDRILKPAIRRSGHVITVSRTTEEDVRSWIDDPSVKVHNSGNGCSPSFTEDGPIHSHGRPYALFVGNFKPHKNPDVAFAAIARVPDLDLVVVSTDTTAAFALVARHGIGERLTVLQSLDDDALASVYRGAEVLLFPSLMEGFGLPVVESLRCGTSVVHLASCASVVEICRHTQFSVESATDPEEFAAAVSAAITSPFTPPPLSEFTWSRVAATIDEILSGILKDRA